MENIYNEVLKGLSNIIIDKLTFEEIRRKIAKKEELTEEEKDKYLQHLYTNAMQTIEDSNETLNNTPKTGRFILKVVTMAGKMVSSSSSEAKDQLEAIATTLEGVKTNKKINFELLRGIRITSNNMIPENFEILEKQNNAAILYNEALEKYIEKYIEYKRNYKKNDFGKDEKETMANSKTKIKELSKQYKAR